MTDPKPKHCPEPWILGCWVQKYVGRKLYYEFQCPPESIHDEVAVYSGVTPGTMVHCSDWGRPGRVPGTIVIGMFFDYSNSSMIFEDEDQRRAVACVNACAGVPTEVLESGTVRVLGLDEPSEAYQRLLAMDPLAPSVLQIGKQKP